MHNETKVATISFNYSDDISSKLTEFMLQQVSLLQSGSWLGNQKPGITVHLSDDVIMTNVQYIMAIDHGERHDDIEPIDTQTELTDLVIVVKYRQYV